MAARSLRARRGGADYWPGFVDALATLLLVIIFLLSVFILAQVFLREALSGRDEALEELNRKAAELADLLQLERSANEELRTSIADLSASLQQTTARLDETSARAGAAEAELERLRKALAEREAAAGELQSRLSQTGSKLEEERRISARARSQIELLNQQIAALRQQLERLEAALDASEEREKESEAVIADLGRRLNRALAQKVEELAKYRSEFFGRLREALGDRPDIRIEGDRFVFQSEVFFASASAAINEDGKRELEKVARTLLEVSREIPDDLNWIVRVDGHTDRRPISTEEFSSNWELSAARAISVVNLLVDRGVPPHRLAAAGFGEHQPLDPADDEIAYRRNRRIELKLTER